MSTLTSILSSDLLSASRSTINTSFNTLNNDKADAGTYTSLLAAKFTVSSVANAALALTTTATDTVQVFSKGYATGSNAASSVAVLYNGVVKDSVEIKQAAAGDVVPFSLMYAETPGAGTHNVQTSVVAGVSSILGVVIIINKIT